MTVIFGGPTWPIGWGAGYLARPYDVARSALSDWLEELSHPVRWFDLPTSSLLDMLHRLAPIQAPWTRRLIVRTKGEWTACFDNSELGGDQASWVGYLSQRLDCEAILARHIPVDQYPLPATQFELLGTQGERPLRYVRTISAGVFDEGRWRFLVSGIPQPFEDLEAYTRRRIRDRLTRAMILAYLSAFGIAADDPAFYDGGAMLEEIRPWTAGGLTIEEVQRRYRP